MPILNSAVTIKDLPPPPPNKSGWPWTEQSQPLPKQMPNGSEWPSISIVTPSYNQSQFIEETIRSVLLQGYPNLEYIIIDGGSKDSSVEIIRKYEPWLSYWVSEADQGQSDALNKGFIHAVGDISAYLNSDDLLMQESLQAVATAFTTEHCYWLASGVLMGESVTQARVWEPEAVNFPLFVVQQSFAQQGVFWQSNVSDKPYFDLTRRYVMDHNFFVNVYRTYGSPYILPQITAFFRLHPASKTSTLEDVLEVERAELIEQVCLQTSSQIATQIRREKKRSWHKQEAHRLLQSKQESVQERVAAALKAVDLLVKDPYPLRDRIFLSVAVKALARVFILNALVK